MNDRSSKSHVYSSKICVAAASQQNGRRRLPFWLKTGHRSAADQCPLYPQKRTSMSAIAMSALCHKQTLRPHSITSSIMGWKALG